MPGWMLDSVALIDWYCGRQGVTPYLEQILSGERQGAFSTVTELELWQGIRAGVAHAQYAGLPSARPGFAYRVLFQRLNPKS
jgi:hypothetical protein